MKLKYLDFFFYKSHILEFKVHVHVDLMVNLLKQ